MEGYYEYRIIRIDIQSADAMTKELMDALIELDKEEPLGNACNQFEVVTTTALDDELIYTVRRKNF